jgi:hypothetical protein
MIKVLRYNFNYKLENCRTIFAMNWGSNNEYSQYQCHGFFSENMDYLEQISSIYISILCQEQGSAEFALVCSNSLFQVNFRADLVLFFNSNLWANFLRVELSPNLASYVSELLENCLKAEQPFWENLPTPGQERTLVFSCIK